MSTFISKKYGVLIKSALKIKNHMSALLAGWRTIFDRIKEIELTIMLNNVTDGAVTLRVKEAVKLANLVQIAFDDQYQRLKPNKIKITTSINTKIRQIAAVLADLITFIPGTAQKFFRLIQQARRDIDILLTQFQFKLPVDGYADIVNKKQKARPLFNNYSVRNEYSAYDRSASAAGAATLRSVSRSKSVRYDPLQDKQLIQLQNILYDIEAEQRRQDDAATQVKCAELNQKIKDIQEHYKQQNFLLQNQISEKDGEIAYIKGQLEQLRQVDDNRKHYIDQLNAENIALKDKITVLQNQCILAETQQNNDKLSQLEEARNTVLLIEKQRNRIHALEQQLSGVSTYVAKEQYKIALDNIPEIFDIKKEFIDQIKLMQGSENYENLELVVNIFVNNIDRALSAQLNQTKRIQSNRDKLSTILREKFDTLSPL